jgi:hypothetical protein
MPTFSGMNGLKNAILKKNYLKVKIEQSRSGSANVNPVSLKFATSLNATVTFPKYLDASTDPFIKNGVQGLSISNDELTASMTGYQLDTSGLRNFLLFMHKRSSKDIAWVNAGFVQKLTTTVQRNGRFSLAISRDGKIIVTTAGMSLTSGISFTVYNLINSTIVATNVSVPGNSNGGGSIALSEDGDVCLCVGYVVSTSPAINPVSITSGLRTGSFTHTLLSTNIGRDRGAVAICNINKVALVTTKDTAQTGSNVGRVVIISYHPTISTFSMQLRNTAATAYQTNLISSMDFLWFSPNSPPAYVFVKRDNVSYIYQWNPSTKRFFVNNSNQTYPIDLTGLVKQDFVNNTYFESGSVYNQSCIGDVIQNGNNYFVKKYKALNIVPVSENTLNKYNSLDIIPSW